MIEKKNDKISAKVTENQNPTLFCILLLKIPLPYFLSDGLCIIMYKEKESIIVMYWLFDNIL